MYYPYLRGKQFELIALRESIEFLKDGKIIPIIEPVKNTVAGLEKTLDILVEAHIKSWLILNPQVGEFKDRQFLLPILFNNEFVNPALIITTKTISSEIRDILENNDVTFDRDYFLIINSLPDDGILDTIITNERVSRIVIDSSINKRRLLRVNGAISSKLISLQDVFLAKHRNKDYLEIESEFFSDEYKFFKVDGFIGFSDYLTIGGDYSESGSLPFAVSIHLTFLNESCIKVAHFVSDTNDDRTDTAGKYLEALNKLIDFVNKNKIPRTKAINIFEELQIKKHYPGLGTLKKLSIMNHLELMSNILQDI